MSTFGAWFIFGIMLGTAILGSVFNAVLALYQYYPTFKHNATVYIVRKLKNSEKFMTWLNKPTKHGKPDMAWIEGQVKVWGDEWR
jgi:hypothetical protein